MGSDPKARISGLDGLRAVAISVVVASHVSSKYFGGGGYVGVELFFVLSGYLITSILLAEFRTSSRIDLLAFYARRALRLLPALLVLLAALAAVAVFRPSDFGTSHPGWALLSSLFYVGNWYRIAAGGSGLLNHTWSLAIEEQFYLLWPPILVFSLKRSKSTRPIVTGLVVAVILVFLLRIALNGHVVLDRIYAGSDTRSDGLLLGCLLALLSVRGLDRSERVRSPLALATVIGGMAFMLAVLLPGSSPLTLSSRGFSFSPEACALIVVGVVTTALPWLNAVLDARLLVWLGKRSYGIYLWHYPALALAITWFGPGMLVRFFAVLFAVLVASASYRYVEMPFLRLKTRFERLAAAAT